MWTAAKRALRYLKGTINHRITFKSRNRRRKKRQTAAFVDSSHAGDVDTRRSRCGHILYYNGSAIHWRSLMQKRTALSTAEANYRALTITTKNILWLRNLMREIGRAEKKTSAVYEDNSACIKMVENPVISARNKFIELDCHFARYHHDRKDIKLKKISTKLQRADMLTKNLQRYPNSCDTEVH